MKIESRPEQLVGIIKIEQAQLVHVPLIHDQLSRFKRNPETPEQIADIINSPDNSIFVEANKRIVCRIRHEPLRRKNYVDWLLPQNELRVELYLVMCEALMDISRRFPNDDDFVTKARFKTGRGCLTILGRGQDFAKKAIESFQTLFPNSSEYTRNLLEGAYYIWGKQGEIVEDIKISPVWQNYRKDKNATPTYT